ncbi:MAG TPA: cation:proton antiporter, partial [Candidatus Nanopelagicales bacterium]|nr:cation:proton antiporter [Candidatus Nanopelagicales bacterium]
FLPGLVGQVPDPEQVLVLLLAPLVFALALETSYLDLRAASRPILLLAVGLVVVTTLTIGVVAATAEPSIPFAVACALGAILAPTDAVAASSSGRAAGLPRRVLTIIEGESLVNDGTALTLLRVAIIAVAAGSVTTASVLGTLAQSVLVGAGVGAAVAFLVSRLLGVVEDQMVGNALLLIAPFLVYLGAERLGGSGLLGVAVAGVWISHSGGERAAAGVRLTSSVVWGELAFLLESVAFLFVGLEVRSIVAQIPDLQWIRFVGVTIATVAVLVVTRGLFVLGARMLTPVGRQVEARAALVIVWAGARGPVSVLAALSLPLVLDDGSPFPHREELIAATFGVVIATLLVSLSLGPLVRRLGFEPEDDADLLSTARDRAATAALARLDVLVADAREQGRPVPDALVNGLRGTVLVRRHMARRPQRLTELYVDWRTEMLEAERAALYEMREEGELPDPVLRELMREIDLRETSAGKLKEQ